MAQIAVRRAGTNALPARVRGTTPLVRMVTKGVAALIRRSQERDEVAAAMSAARTGRETGVRC